VGTGNITNQTSPVQVSGLSNISQIALSDNSSCALRSSDNVVLCWGDNSFGQNGSSTTGGYAATPAAAVGLSTPVVRTIAAGKNHFCAIRSNNAVWCWGSGASGQLGAGTSNSGSPIDGSAGLTDYDQLALGDDFSCALRLTGAVRCWGLNAFGQFGTGSTSGTANPGNITAVSGTFSVVQVSAGGRSACARLSSGELRCWGNNDWAQLGGNGSLTSTPNSVFALGITTASHVEVGGNYALAIMADGSLRYWGSASAGIPGDGSSTQPVKVSGF
jgi:alpha-tubulin suppressor-like RCC1 family protein